MQMKIEELLKPAMQYDSTIGNQQAVFDDKLRLEAEHAVAGEIHYNDGQYVFIGRTDIDWTGSHIANHVWKERPKRFLYLPSLMAGYNTLQDERYAEAARDYIADWMRIHPACQDWKMPHYDNGLNLGIRVVFFAQALAAFCSSPAWDDAFLTKVIDDIGCELRYIGSNLSPKGNFRMVQAMALIQCGLRLPFVSEAKNWLRQGVEIMNDAARRQVLPGGVHIECTAGYHGWMTQLFSDCLKLQRTWPDIGFSFTVDMVADMHDYSVAATRPNGTYCGMHDIEGAWEGTHENVAAKRRTDFRQTHGLPDVIPAECQIFQAAGQAYLRNSWDSDATYLTFDATRWGGAHCHLSRNSIQLHAFGRTLLMDPGRIAYEMSDPLGPYAKSTRAHNTVNLNGWNQFTTNPDDFRCFHSPGYDCVSSRYSAGYWPGEYGWWFFNGLGKGLAATHTRHMFWVHNRWCLVIDEVTRWNEDGRCQEYESPDLELNWQFSPGIVTVDAAKRQVNTRHSDANLLLVVAAAPANAIIETYEGTTNPLRGWVRDYSRFAGVPAPQVSLTCHPWHGYTETLVTLLVPYHGTKIPDVTTDFIPGDIMKGKPARLVLIWSDGTQETVNWIPGLETMLGNSSELETDGILSYIRNNSDVAAVDATYVRNVQNAMLLTRCDDNAE
jgi:hypothetical protein